MEVLQTAAGAGCEPLLQLLVALPECKALEASGRAPYVAAARHGDRATPGALRRLGVPWAAGDGVEAAAEARCAESVLRWLVEQGAPVGSREELGCAVGEAMRRGRLGAEAAAWLRGLEPTAGRGEERRKPEGLGFVLGPC